MPRSASSAWVMPGAHSSRGSASVHEDSSRLCWVSTRYGHATKFRDRGGSTVCGSRMSGCDGFYPPGMAPRLWRLAGRHLRIWPTRSRGRPCPAVVRRRDRCCGVIFAARILGEPGAHRDRYARSTLPALHRSPRRRASRRSSSRATPATAGSAMPCSSGGLLIACGDHPELPPTTSSFTRDRPATKQCRPQDSGALKVAPLNP